MLQRAREEHLELLGVLGLLAEEVEALPAEDLRQVPGDVDFRLLVDVEHEDHDDRRREKNQPLVENELLEALADEPGVLELREARVEDERERVVLLVDVLGAEVGPDEDGERDAGEAGRYEEVRLHGVQEGDHVGRQDPNRLVEDAEGDHAEHQHDDAVGQVDQRAAAEVHEDDQHARDLHAEEDDAVRDRHVPDDLC